jgi:hypothetical protein
MSHDSLAHASGYMTEDPSQFEALARRDDLSRQQGSEKRSFRTIRESSTQVGHNRSNPRRIRATMSDRIHRVPVSPTSVDVTDARKGL